PHQLYIREARRMIGEYVLTQHDLLDNIVKYDGIGMGSYNMDIRHNQTTFHWASRFPDLVPETINEGYLSIPVKPYEIPFRSLLPKYEECSNLIVPICISSSNLAFASFRMEPQYMIAGHAAGVAAAIASKKNLELHKLSVTELQAKLVEQGQIISFEQNPNGYFQQGNTVIVDDDMGRFVEQKGEWSRSEDVSVGRHGITFLLSDPKESAEIIYSPYLPKTGKYKVYGWWPKLKHGSSSVKLQIKTKNNAEILEVDQKNTGDTWEYIGTFNFGQGSESAIILSNAGTKGKIIADAFKFELVEQ
ncbi:MAG: FAD-dependent oxidoreductase, partial [Arenibacter troitsensis]|nr:FAD-dependent oxidoreductase [Arenibacter troitsensis]